MKTNELREQYLSFFESKGCTRRPTDVLVPRDDKSVLFTPAGMNQFKNQFLGIGPLEFTKATTCQICLRTGDIENVGVTAYHHTFFEMLGNFSFGDYFKKEAIHWAWEFLTTKKWLGLDPSRLRVTVYLDDDVAYKIWHDEIKLPANKISRENEGENFWPANSPSQGPDGVCGPCSEIYYHPPGSNSDVEIWNLVFTQFNRVGNPPNNLRPLPKKNIDTGMGLERCASTLQGVYSNFEIDTLKPLCQAAGDAVGEKYSFDSKHGRALRRIADHVRAVTFCLHEGVEPGPEKQSYIVRQLLRRAVLEGYLIGKHEPFLHTLVPAVVTAMGAPYPDIAKTAANVATAIKAEEEQFLGTIEKGIHKFHKLVEDAKKGGRSVIPGEAAWDLHATDGFLVELTQAMAAHNNLSVDRERFNELFEQHKIGSGKGNFDASVMAAGPLAALQKTTSGTEFIGYETTHSVSQVLGIIAEKQLVDEIQEVGHAEPIGVVLNRTPFYGEAGGQVGDTGTLVGEGCEFFVQDTQKNGNLYIHIGHLKKGKLKVGTKVTAQIDEHRRSGIRRAHSATHLLHHALQNVLGGQALQRGSKVEEDHFRFDFTHSRAVSPEQLQQIEEMVNTKITEGATVTSTLMDLESAKKAGATALFGEKYPDRVRVVTMGEYSKELCGGTHLTNTSQVGLCKVVSEESTSKGVRRISAYTGPRAFNKIRQDEQLLKELAAQLKAQRVEDLPERIRVLQEEVRTLKRDLSKQSTQSAAGLVDTLVAEGEKVGSTAVITHLVDSTDADGLRAIIDQIRRKAGSCAILLGSVHEEKIILIAGLSSDLVDKKLSASEWVKAAAKIVGGGGGGRPDLAQAGGKDASKMKDALQTGKDWLKTKLA